MLGKIIYIGDNVAHLQIDKTQRLAENLMNMHIIFEDHNKKILGEAYDVGENIIKVRFIGKKLLIMKNIL